MCKGWQHNWDTVLSDKNMPHKKHVESEVLLFASFQGIYPAIILDMLYIENT